MLVLFSYRNNESQIGSDKLVFGSLAFWSALLNLLCEFYFLVNRYQGCAAYLYKIFV